jgi:hypothetical protein
MEDDGSDSDSELEMPVPMICIMDNDIQLPSNEPFQLTNYFSETKGLSFDRISHSDIEYDELDDIATNFNLLSPITKPIFEDRDSTIVYDVDNTFMGDSSDCSLSLSAFSSIQSTDSSFHFHCDCESKDGETEAPDDSHLGHGHLQSLLVSEEEGLDLGDYSEYCQKPNPLPVVRVCDRSKSGNFQTSTPQPSQPKPMLTIVISSL